MVPEVPGVRRVPRVLVLRVLEVLEVQGLKVLVLKVLVLKVLVPKVLVPKVLVPKVPGLRSLARRRRPMRARLRRYASRCKPLPPPARRAGMRIRTM